MAPINPNQIPQYKKDKIEFLMEVINNDRYTTIVRQTARNALESLGVDLELHGSTYQNAKEMVDETYRRYYNQRDELDEAERKRVVSRVKRAALNLIIGFFVLFGCLFLMYTIFPDAGKTPDKTTTTTTEQPIKDGRRL